MNAYPLIRPLLFQLDAETAHNVTLKSLSLLSTLRLQKFLTTRELIARRTAFGLEFKNPIGLAAGLDKNADYVDALGKLGFGFIEVGTVTPRPQVGNPKPRLFRIPKAEAIINRMGFNNKGVDHLVQRLKFRRYNGIVGVNIGKNADTPLENANDDYLICLKKVYEVADYIVINISSPNTPGLRDLQHAESLRKLLSLLLQEREQLARAHGKTRPLILKIAPDMSDEQVSDIAGVVSELALDGVIATNTTISRNGVEQFAQSAERGGLSGKPVTGLSTHIIQVLRNSLRPQIPIIGVGGIMSGADAKEKIDSGASLVQLYTGLIYRGPTLIEDCFRALEECAPERKSYGNSLHAVA